MSAIAAIRRSSDGPDRHARQDNGSAVGPGERQDWLVLSTFRPTSDPVLQIRPSQTDDHRFSLRRISLRHRTAPVTGIYEGSSKMHSWHPPRLLIIFPCITIGSRPAGHTAAIYLARTDLEPILFEGFATNGFAACGQLTTTTNRTHSTAR